jgi:polysaccharide export outer membrane protein
VVEACSRTYTHFAGPSAKFLKLRAAGRFWGFAAALAGAILCYADSALPTANLPTQRLGPNDLIALNVLGSPELTRTFRIGDDGQVRLPLLPQPIRAAGKLPSDLESEIAGALRKADLLVDPVVTVTVAEYVSRPVTVAGAVKNPSTIQAMSGLRLLEAITKAGGLSDDAGAEILVQGKKSDGTPDVHRVLVKDLINQQDDAANLALEGGEQIRVPRAPRIFIMGNVRKPGAIALADSAESSVMKALALAEGLAPFASSKAYILRNNPSATERDAITVDVTRIMERKTPDVQLKADDIFYVPDNKSKRLSAGVLDRLISFGSATSSGVLIWRK